jgi:hypothetical protein
MLKWPAGGMSPEFQAPPSEVDVWVVVSLLTHVIVVPRVTLMGLGL